MEWDIVAQCVENNCLLAAMAKLIDCNWSQDKTLDDTLDHIWELESQVKMTEELLKESHVNHTALDVEVIGLQERVKKLELEMKWTRGISDMHTESFDSFGAQVKELEKFIKEQEEYNHHNTIMTRGLSHHCLWGFHHHESLGACISDLEREAQLESHCSHCPMMDSEIKRGLSGWTACTDTMQWPTQEDCKRQVREDDKLVKTKIRQEDVEDELEILEEPYKFASPATTQSMSTCPVSPSEGESGVDGVSITTHGTTPSPDENVVPLPVVCGVIQSACHVCPSPYCVPATASHLHIDPSIIHHYVLSVIREWPNQGVVQIGNTPYDSVCR